MIVLQKRYAVFSGLREPRCRGDDDLFGRTIRQKSWHFEEELQQLLMGTNK